MKDRRLKFLWNSNGVNVGSGYGVYSRDLLYRLLKDEWKVGQIAFTGIEGGVVHLDGLPVYPKMGDVWGSDAMVMHGRHFGANAVFSMQDAWPLDPNMLRQINHWIPYCPIDKDPVPPSVLDKLRFAYKIITFSRFGQKALEKAGFASTLILESTDPDIFKPMDKAECRKELGLPLDKFIFGQIGANKPDAYPRKGWQQSLDAFKLFHDKYPDSIYFYEVNQPGGFPIEQYAAQIGIGKEIFKIDPYMSVFHADSKIMAKMLNAFDVTLHPSTTEGFGLVIIESQACGTPIIVNNCTSQPELVVDGVTGEICNVGHSQYTMDGSFVYYADVNSLFEKMEKLYKADRKKMGEEARKHILENYDINKSVQTQWVPFLESLQIELLGNLTNPESKPTI